MERGRKMTENSYKTPCGCIHYFVNIMDKQRITLVFLPGLTADHRLFEKQIEYFEKRQNVFVWDAPSHALSRPFANSYRLSDMAEWLYKILVKEEIYKIIRNLADEGKSMIVVSSELDELLRICDNIIVMFDGKEVMTSSKENFNPDKIISVSVTGRNES